MSLSEQIARVVGGHNNALRELLKQFGTTVPSDKKAEYFQTAAASIGNRYQYSNFITSDTSGLYGLPDTAVPNDVLNWLGKYNTHWWSELHGEAGTGYEEVRTDSLGMGFMVFTTSITLTCSKSISIDQSTGSISLVSPFTVQIDTVPYRGSQSVSEMVTEVNKLLSSAPVYAKGLQDDKNTVYYFPVGSDASESRNSTISINYQDGDGWSLYVRESATVKAKTVTSSRYSIPAGETVYVNSTDRNAYPDNGVQNELTYRYLGNPFDNSVKSLGIERGQYVGTGLYGASNPNSITFKRIPQMLFIHTGPGMIDYGGSYPTAGALIDCTKIADGTEYTQVKLGSMTELARFSGNTLYWYCTASDPLYQFNSSQVLYYYTSIY